MRVLTASALSALTRCRSGEAPPFMRVLTTSPERTGFQRWWSGPLAPATGLSPALPGGPSRRRRRAGGLEARGLVRAHPGQMAVRPRALTGAGGGGPGPGGPARCRGPRPDPPDVSRPPRAASGSGAANLTRPDTHTMAARRPEGDRHRLQLPHDMDLLGKRQSRQPAAAGLPRGQEARDLGTHVVHSAHRSRRPCRPKTCSRWE